MIKLAPDIRILHSELAAAIADLRHGEMICLADAGSVTSWASIAPLDGKVQLLDIGVATNVPSLTDVLPALFAVSEYERAFVADHAEEKNPKLFGQLTSSIGAENVDKISYAPDFLKLRNRCRLVVRTGDYSMGGNTILVAGYPSQKLDIDVLTSSDWMDKLPSGL